MDQAATAWPLHMEEDAPVLVIVSDEEEENRPGNPAQATAKRRATKSAAEAVAKPNPRKKKRAEDVDADEFAVPEMQPKKASTRTKEHGIPSQDPHRDDYEEFDRLMARTPFLRGSVIASQDEDVRLYTNENVVG